MQLPDYPPDNNNQQWDRFCELLWYSEELGIWLDVSRMNIKNSDFQKLNSRFSKAFESMEELEDGGIANKDEERMVGHYWLRNPKLAPNELICKSISSQINDIELFGQSILNGNLLTQDNQKFTDIVWIGIGGSGLGPILLTNSMQNSNRGLNFHFFDNVDPEGIRNKIDKLKDNLSTTLFVVVSKSGGTPEPKICMDQVRFFVESSGKEWKSQAVAITMKQSKLYKLAYEENWLRIFDLPDWVGGRTSITSAVGLLPITLMGFDNREFLEGASSMDKITRVKNISSNPAALLALAWYLSGDGKGYKDMVVLPYCDSLEVFSKYLQQLIMESLGKKNDRKGNEVNQGLAVYGNKGSTDQHAYVQQLRDGIDNFFVTFIEVLNNPNNLPTLDDSSPSEYLSGFYQGTRLALSQNKRQNLSITIKQLDLHSLGALIALFERAVGLYAELVDINAYDQPGVEAGKIAASDIINVQLQIQRSLSTGIEYTINELHSKIKNSTPESIYIILRSMAVDLDKYTINGDWSDPKSLSIMRNK